MKRHFLPGSYDAHEVPRATACCTGECNQGRSCPLTVDRVCAAVVPLKPVRQRPAIGAQLAPGQVIHIRAAVQRMKVSRTRRAWRAFIDFLLSPCWGE